MGCAFILLRIVVVLISLGTAALLVFHLFPHCSAEAEGFTIPICDVSVMDECRPAFTIQTEMNNGGVNIKFKISCPWSPITVVVGLLGMAASSYLYIALCCCMKKSACKVFTLLVNGVVVLLFLICSIMMVVDITKGSSYFNEFTGGAEGPSQNQLLYIINLVLGIITTLGFLAIFVVVWRTKTDNNIVKLGGGGGGMNHSRIEIPNTSVSANVPSGQKMGWNDTYETQGHNTSFQQYNTQGNVMQHGHGQRNASPQRQEIRMSNHQQMGGQQQMGMQIQTRGGHQNLSPNRGRPQQGFRQ